MTKVKWIGTLLILGIGFAVAFYMTYQVKVKEEKSYVVTMPEYLFDLKDGKRFNIQIGIAFQDYKIAKAASKKYHEVFELLKGIIAETDSAVFSSPPEMLKLKMLIMAELYNMEHQVEYVSIHAKPIEAQQ